MRNRAFNFVCVPVLAVVMAAATLWAAHPAAADTLVYGECQVSLEVIVVSPIDLNSPGCAHTWTCPPDAASGCTLSTVPGTAGTSIVSLAGPVGMSVTHVERPSQAAQCTAAAPAPTLTYFVTETHCEPPTLAFALSPGETATLACQAIQTVAVAVTMYCRGMMTILT